MRHVGSDPQAERGRGEVNFSPIRVLTLRPRVGGFFTLWLRARRFTCKERARAFRFTRVSGVPRRAEGWLAGWQAGKTPNVIVSQKCINLIAKTYRFEHISCPSYRLAGQLAGWLAGRLPAVHLGHQNASKTRTLSTKVRRKCVPLSRKSISNRVGWRVEGVKNAYPLAESASKTRTLRQKVVFEASKTCTLRQKVRQKHAPLGRN